MPNALELPRMLGAVVPLMRARDTVVNELVAFAFWHAVRTFQFLRAAAGRVPRFAAVIRALNDLPKPAAGLRGVDPVRINRRAFHVINFPTRKMRATHLPSFARAIRSQDECALSCANQYSYVAHDLNF